jgi:2-dehydro-3-deoxyphosphogluconate aldolase/(4S)-4-hydroxy-2-oxoglutarate aldolase
MSKTPSAFESIARIGVVPVVTVESVEAALPLADSLLEEGLPIVEVTFRTAAAAGVIEAIRRARPEMLVGAGTVVTAENLRSAIGSGAQFGVAPGLNPDIVAQASRGGLPFVPGICTPSEIERAMALGCRLLKFFPSEAIGGAATISAMTAPYGHLGLQLMPSGGVTLDNMAIYLRTAMVVAVGATTIARKEDLASGNWAEIRGRCRRAATIVAEARSG